MAENLIHGGEVLASYIQKLIALLDSFIPEIWDIIKFGTVTPVFKNKGNKNDAKNYRGITITPTLSRNYRNSTQVSYQSKNYQLTKSTTKRLYQKCRRIILLINYGRISKRR